jgi:hypothetical protein
MVIRIMCQTGVTPVWHIILIISQQVDITPVWHIILIISQQVDMSLQFDTLFWLSANR